MLARTALMNATTRAPVARLRSVRVLDADGNVGQVQFKAAAGPAVREWLAMVERESAKLSEFAVRPLATFPGWR